MVPIPSMQRKQAFSAGNLPFNVRAAVGRGATNDAVCPCGGVGIDCTLLRARARSVCDITIIAFTQPPLAAFTPLGA